MSHTTHSITKLFPSKEEQKSYPEPRVVYARHMVKGSKEDLENLEKYLSSNHSDFKIYSGGRMRVEGGNKEIWENIKKLFQNLEIYPDVIIPLWEEPEIMAEVIPSVTIAISTPDK